MLQELTNKIKKGPCYRHGMYGTRPYNIWSGIKRRCYNKNEINYSRYGGKGVKMSDRWLNFINFWSDMKDGYDNTKQIDRIDNKKGYCKDNCRWVSIKEQANNKKSVARYNFNGELLTISQIANKIGINRRTLYTRLKVYKMPLEKAFYPNKFYPSTNKVKKLLKH
jgi:hypothetical protein